MKILLKIISLIYLVSLLISTSNMSSINTTTNIDIETQWVDFLRTYGKNYTTEEKNNKRFQTFKSNVEFIEAHNGEAREGKQLYTVKVNEYADLTPGEFFTLINGIDPNSRTRKFVVVSNNENRNNVTENNTDYQKTDSIKKPTIATGAIEAFNAKKTGKLIQLSEQNLIDCSLKYGNRGCNGGFMIPAFKYVIQNRGMNSEENYPYEAKTSKCRFKRTDANLVRIRGFLRIKPRDEADLESILVKRGPVAAAIDASRRGLQFYNQGIYLDSTCKNDEGSLNHAILVVGCGVDNGNEYWLIKNSWGTSWGDNGYFKLAKNRENACGIANNATIPT